jgi:hypothetical protein
MIRFTVREILLLTALVGSCVAWRLESHSLKRAQRVTRAHAEQLREALSIGKSQFDEALNPPFNNDILACGTFKPRADWKLAKHPTP